LNAADTPFTTGVDAVPRSTSTATLTVCGVAALVTPVDTYTVAVAKLDIPKPIRMTTSNPVGVGPVGWVTVRTTWSAMSPKLAANVWLAGRWFSLQGPLAQVWSVVVVPATPPVAPD
jgi:hypothetical protein